MEAIDEIRDRCVRWLWVPLSLAAWQAANVLQREDAGVSASGRTQEFVNDFLQEPAESSKGTDGVELSSILWGWTLWAGGYALREGYRRATAALRSFRAPSAPEPEADDPSGSVAIEMESIPLGEATEPVTERDASVEDEETSWWSLVKSWWWGLAVTFAAILLISGECICIEVHRLYVARRAF